MDVVRTVGAFVEALDDYCVEGGRPEGRRFGRQRVEGRPFPGRAPVGLVPTMGALHAGHRSLIAQSVRECPVTAVTIFVNPLQFEDPSDLASYPCTLDSDLEVCASAGATMVFTPPVTEMYPNWPEAVSTVVSVPSLAQSWEGRSRPGHFDGVTTVVAKLFSMVGHCRAYFGEKDFQQLLLVRRLAADLSMPVEVIGCPVVREPDGLALSSRNVRLNRSERRAAVAVPRALAAGREALSRGGSGAAVEGAMRSMVEAEPLAVLDYAALVRSDDLSPLAAATAVELAEPGQSRRLLIAARIGEVRLIDNCDASADDEGALLIDGLR